TLGAGFPDLDSGRFLFLGRRRQNVLQLFHELFRNLLGAAAFRIGAAAKEGPTRAALHYHRTAALGAAFARFNGPHAVPLGTDVLGVAALRIAGASQERSALAFANHHGFAAFFTHMFRRLAGQHRLALGIKVHRRLAIGVAAASEKWPALTNPLQHWLATF